MLIYVLFAFIYVCFTFCVWFVFRYIWLILCKKKFQRRLLVFILVIYYVVKDCWIQFTVVLCPFRCPYQLLKLLKENKITLLFVPACSRINLNSSTGLWIVNIKNFYRDTFMIGSSRNIFQVWKTTPSLPRWLISVMSMRVRTLTHTKQWNAKRR